MEFHVRKERWGLAVPFRTAIKTVIQAEVVVVEVRDVGHRGRGEGNPIARYQQTADSVIAQLEAVRPAIERGLSRDEVQTLLPAGSARNALDCALWDLHAKQSGRGIWHLAGLAKPGPLAGSITVGVGPPAEMAERARAYAKTFALLKVKLGKDRPVHCIEAVRRAAPKMRLMVDANEAWTLAMLKSYAPQLKALGVEMIEQPLARGADEGLAAYGCPLPLCADESCFERSDLETLEGRYDFINIKLDKTGGLTEALALAQKARKQGFGLMTGCMVGTSLAMAPGFVVSSLCAYRDLDGALLLGSDRDAHMEFRNGFIQPISAELWG